MAARENQGLQISLIASVMLVIILSVTTYVFFRQADEAQQKEKTAQDTVIAKTKELADREGFLADVKKFAGFKDTEPRPDCSTAFNTDVTTYGQGVADPDYRKLVKHLHSVIQAKDVELDNAKQSIEKLNKDFLAREGIAKPKIDRALVEAKTHKDELENKSTEFQTARDTLTKEKQAIEGKWTTAVKEREVVVLKGRERIKEAEERLKRVVAVSTNRQDQIEKLTKPTFETALGKVTWVNQRNGTVWINLGQADSLSRLTSFSVYDAGATDVSRAEKKASIEVTQIVGEHLAEARILEDKLATPIVPGDVIHTPIWAPGEQKHMAITGLVDINGDGKSDLDTLITLIRANSGVVDCWLDENGALHGKMNERTTYLIKGLEPNVHGEKSDRKQEQTMLENWNSMLNEANRLTIKVITVRDFLDKLGHKDRNQVIQFGPGAPSGQFKAQPPEGKMPVSSGTVTPLFQPRQPPRSSSSGAY